MPNRRRDDVSTGLHAIGPQGKRQRKCVDADGRAASHDGIARRHIRAVLARRNELYQSKLIVCRDQRCVMSEQIARCRREFGGRHPDVHSRGVQGTKQPRDVIL